MLLYCEYIGFPETYKPKTVTVKLTLCDSVHKFPIKIEDFSVNTMHRRKGMKCSSLQHFVVI
jgi:hypothetical protein